MRFRFTLPSLNLRSVLLSSVLFFFVIVQVILSRLHTASIAASQGTNNAMIEDFIAGTPRVGTTPSSIGSSVNTLVNTSKCIPFNSAFHFEPTTEYKLSATLPQWMKDYFDWHREQTSKINSCNYRDYQFVILRCSDKERKCGGAADRIKSLPFFIGAAASSKRIFLIRWQRPTKLEEFLVPNEINWSFPDWMYNVDIFDERIFLPTGKRLFAALTRYKDVHILESLLQDFFGGSAYYYRFDTELDDQKEFDAEYAKKEDDHAGWLDYEVIYRDLFYSVFEPAPPVEKQIRDHMQLANLSPGKFSTAHYRAFYAVEHEKDVVTDEMLTKKARNAINCASRLQPGDPIYFASDSHVAVLSAKELAESQGRKIVTFDDEKEALHLDKKDQWKSGNVSDFYPTFVDLLIMAEGKCMSHGVGGYGRFANLLSHDPKCEIRHDGANPRKFHTCNWVGTKEEVDLW